VRVQIASCPQNRLYEGLEGLVVGYDFVPFNDASEANPLIDLLLADGTVIHLSLSDVRSLNSLGRYP
jgi:hypothetical protein